ncbi:MAG TPA: response regulator transcription factor [Candidatus Paceibacterota bacterium]|nr:response regulator transcription factor [Candidatus Paceibacterota bacterium]
MSKHSVSRIKKVFIVEDHPVFREGLRQMVNREAGFTVCGEAEDFRRALKEIRLLKPDIALVDISLPGGSGLELIKKIRASNRKIKLLAVSMHDEALYADRVLRAGGDGYIMKHEDPEEILCAICDVLNGRLYVSENVLNHSGKTPPPRSTRPEKSSLDQLTDLQLEILELLGLGKNNAEIARALQCTNRVVADHCVHIRKKLNLRTANALVRYAVCWVETDNK